MLKRFYLRAETTTIMIGYNTPLEIIEELKVRINQYVSDNSREWVSGGVLIDKMEYQNAIHLIIVMERKRIHLTFALKQLLNTYQQTDRTGRTGEEDGLVERRLCETLRRFWRTWMSGIQCLFSLSSCPQMPRAP
jgi:hypothetical protein